MSDHLPPKPSEFPCLHLLGIIGGLTPQPAVAEQPKVTLINWRALKTPAGAIHLIGYCIEREEGRASTALTVLDPLTRHSMTASGRIYELSGPPGRSRDATWVWGHFAAESGIIDEVDVTDSFEAAIAQAEAEPGRYDWLLSTK